MKVSAAVAAHNLELTIHSLDHVGGGQRVADDVRVVEERQIVLVFLADFADKCRLFEAIVEEQALERRQLAFYFDPACDIKTTLRKFGEAYIGVLCRPGGRAAARMVFAIAERMPEVGRRYYELLLQKTVNDLAEYLDAC